MLLNRQTLQSLLLMNNLRFSPIVFLAIFALLPDLFVGTIFGQEQILDRIVAVVGREYILQSDLEAQTEFFAFNNKVSPDTPGLRQQVLESMINEKLVLTEAQQDTTLTVTDDEVNSQLEALIEQRVQNPQIGSEKRLEEIYGMPISRMKREFRDEMRKQLLVQRLQQMKFGVVQATRRDVEQFYVTYKDTLPRVPEEMELYHIYRVPKMGESAKALVKGKAQTILDAIRSGGDFAKFAQEYSDDRATAVSGGDLGSWRRGQFVKEFEEIVFSLKENQVSDVVETSRGFHIIQLLERHGESVHARHILFKTGLDSAGVNACIAFLGSIRDSALMPGGSFTDMARRHSEDKETAPVGGFIGRYAVEQFDQSLLQTVEMMKEGEISAPVSVVTGSVTGYHIVYVKRRIAEHAMNLEDDWKRVDQLATTLKKNQIYQKWLKDLREEIYWDVRL